MSETAFDRKMLDHLSGVTIYESHIIALRQMGYTYVMVGKCSDGTPIHLHMKLETENPIMKPVMNAETKAQLSVLILASALEEVNAMHLDSRDLYVACLGVILARKGVTESAENLLRVVEALNHD